MTIASSKYDVYFSDILRIPGAVRLNPTGHAVYLMADS